MYQHVVGNINSCGVREFTLQFVAEAILLIVDA